MVFLDNFSRKISIGWSVSLILFIPFEIESVIAFVSTGLLIVKYWVFASTKFIYSKKVNSFLGNSFEKFDMLISFILNFGKSPGGKPSRVKKIC